jgi:hypothetical protein
VRKDNDDFYFTGKIKPGVDPVASMMFGLLGSLLSSTNTEYWFMKIDHNNGNFIRIRRIPESAF